MKTVALAFLALAIAQPATAATRNYGVNGFDRIRVDGDYRVKVRNGVAPFARASGSARALDSVSVTVEGKTLVVRTNRSATWGGFGDSNSEPIEIEVGTHELESVQVNGAGVLALDRAEGLRFAIAAQGAGSVSVERLEIDQLTLTLMGASSARLAGEAGKATIIARGTASLDAEALRVKDAVVGTQGPSVIKLTATETAKVDAAGVSTIALAGSPACTVKTHGAPSVTGCKASRWR